MRNGHVYQLRFGDGNEGTRVEDYIAIPDWIEKTPGAQVDYQYDALCLVAHALTINRYIPKHKTRRFVMDTMPTEDGDQERDYTLVWDEGPGGATAFGSAWLVAQFTYVGHTSEVRRDNPHYLGPDRFAPLSIYDKLDKGAKRWLSNRGIKL